MGCWKNTCTYIGEDQWGRSVFRFRTGRILVDVDGQLHSCTEQGEPIEPIGLPTPPTDEPPTN